MRNGFLITLLVIASGFSAMAEQGDIIVALKNKSGLRSMESLGLEVSRTLVEDLGVVLVRPSYSVLDTRKLLNLLRTDNRVRWAQLDHVVTARSTTPNDPEFSKQWSLLSPDYDADIRATLAWDIGQGGKTVDGEDVVVAVVDQGVDATHLSLIDNIWTNAGEIAGNGIDDDNNGYVDDVHGWNAVNDKGDVPGERHATHVAGIIGARGNDGSQVTGVNWTAKIMSVRVLGSGSKDLTSTVLDGYGYILKQKKAWLDSAGTAGANIVATNSSFGVDYANCASGEYPAWNDIYNAMGEVGILSAAATANMNIDVDTAGDVPTGCSSNFIISVTNTNDKGVKNSSAGYGLTTIDIGSPGTNILSTVPGQKLERLTGTSMATPHVTGSIGFLHSVASPQFRQLARTQPADSALVLKQILLDTVTPQADLAGKVVSGGRLNLHGAALAASSYSAK